MKLSEVIKPISYLKSHASQIIREVCGSQKTIVITQNGEAKAVIQDIHLYEVIQEGLAMLKILALSNQSLRQGKTKPMEESFAAIRSKMKDASTE